METFSRRALTLGKGRRKIDRLTAGFADDRLSVNFCYGVFGRALSCFFLLLLFLFRQLLLFVLFLVLLATLSPMPPPFQPS